MKKETIVQLLSVKSIIEQIENNDYNKPLDVLSGSTIGKHVRHILEFYECLFISSVNNLVCYDERKRNFLLENNVRFTCDYIDEIIDFIEKVEINKRILLKSKFEDEDIIMETSLYREITYNIEHTTHHLAIIRIGIAAELSYIKLPSNFGYAQSTVQYLKSQKEAIN